MGSKGLEKFGSRGRVGTGEIEGVEIGGVRVRSGVGFGGLGELRSEGLGLAREIGIRGVGVGGS